MLFADSVAAVVSSGLCFVSALFSFPGTWDNVRLESVGASPLFRRAIKGEYVRP